jgi:ABC-type polysaccharide/polyol phosphate transport system ATPase subunit
VESTNLTDIAIRVENLSKLYHIGRAQKRHDTLRDALADVLPRIARITRNRNNSSNSWQDSDDTIWALKDVSFEVKRGEVVGIIGRNGVGKSTLTSAGLSAWLKMLSRITEPTKGRALIDGRVGSLLEVGTGFHPELTGRENIYLNGAIPSAALRAGLGTKRAEIDRKFDEIVAFAEIEKFLDTPVKHYSSGMYVWLAMFAREIWRFLAQLLQQPRPDQCLKRNSFAPGHLFDCFELIFTQTQVNRLVRPSGPANGNSLLHSFQIMHILGSVVHGKPIGGLPFVLKFG